ncbi:unnamed protein product (macronuclear) [Paramecium tetraurelia]|uniref:Uncharacterized protein n=1 Tax=Paramecium tetraurelia TaxID=5888 RepID=A0EB29_PARTE|nr:uncharacterized protein GSPATT00025230001 [Paramecium tetraurelia]CAK92496.1 unnamed protein product [Paramecium tetraurelia]|eukprot:XP_001459893.1 hypothetical protein (macronuclear) [Paramecium tetraurelia strain d4-2]
MIKLRYFFSNIHKTKAYQNLVKQQKAQVDLVQNYMNQMKQAKSEDELIKLKYQSINDLQRIKEEQSEIIEQIKLEKKKNFEKHLISMEVDPEDIQKLYKGKQKKNKDEIVIDDEKQNTNQEQNTKQTQEETKINVPNNLEIRNLASPIRTQGHLILFGVQRHNAQHSSYIYDALFNLKPQVILTDLPVDDPFFIKTEGNYTSTWKSFIENKLTPTFLVNPQPITLSDIHLHKNKIKWIFENNILKNSQFIINPTNISEITKPMFDKEIEIIDILKSPFLYSYHHSTPIVINGYPEINYRYFLAENCELDNLKQLLNEKKIAKQEKQRNFDPCLLQPDLFILPKIKFMIETIKMTLTSYSNGIIITESNKINQIEEEWISSAHRFISTDLRTQLHPIKPIKESEEFIKKLIILDELISPYIYNNFVRYNSFPYQFNSVFKISLQQYWDNYKNQLSR